MNINEKLKAVLPKSTMIYLDPKEGLTSSEANHIANMIKEIARKYTSEVEGSCAATETIRVDKDFSTLKTGFIAPMSSFKKPGQLFGLSAWLRSAIKSRDGAFALLDQMDAKRFDFDNTEPSFGVQAPSREMVGHGESFPKDPDPASILDIAELAEYYYYEAQAATIGKYIHESSVLDKIRKDILNFNEMTTRTINDVVYFVKREPACSKDEISNLYFGLQKEYRDAESKLNWYKSKIKTVASQHNIRVNQDYTVASNKANAEYDAVYTEYSKLLNAYREQHKVWKNNMETERVELHKYLAAHKIIIPKFLQPIFEEVKTILG